MGMVQGLIDIEKMIPLRSAKVLSNRLYSESTKIFCLAHEPYILSCDAFQNSYKGKRLGPSLLLEDRD